MPMNSKTQILTTHYIKYSNQIIPFSLYQTERKSLRIEVSPYMQVTVKAPKIFSHEQIIDRIQKK